MVFLVVMPFTSRVLVFTKNSHRWCFMICFVEALAIGLFLQDVFREKNKKTVLCGGALATIIYAAMMVFVYSFKNIKVNNKIAAEDCAFFVVYLLLLVGERESENCTGYSRLLFCWCLYASFCTELSITLAP